MRRFRGSSRGLSEIVGTLILILIVVAAATALSVFVTGYEKTVLSQEADSHEKTLESYSIFGINIPETYEAPQTVHGNATWDLASGDSCLAGDVPSNLSYSNFSLSAPFSIPGIFGPATIGPGAICNATLVPNVVTQPFSATFIATQAGSLSGASVTITYNDSFASNQTPSASPSATFDPIPEFNASVPPTPLGYYVFDVASTTVESSQISSITINNEPALWYCALPPDSVVYTTSTCSGPGSSGMGGTWIPLGKTLAFTPLQEYEILVNYNDPDPGLLYNGTCNSFNTSETGGSASCPEATNGWPAISPTGTLRIAFDTAYTNTFSQVMQAPIAIASVGTIAIPGSGGTNFTYALNGAASLQLGGNDSILAWFWIIKNTSGTENVPTVPFLSGEEVPFSNSTSYWSAAPGTTYSIELIALDGTGLWSSDTITWTFPR